MPAPAPSPTDVQSHPDDETDDHSDELVSDEVLVEEISIDGMCGVY